MTKFNFQFEQDDKDVLRQCRMLVVVCNGRLGFADRLCSVMNSECCGYLNNRPEWCPLTVVETIGDYLKGE